LLDWFGEWNLGRRMVGGKSEAPEEAVVEM
jgi:hypothetical protein